MNQNDIHKLTAKRKAKPVDSDLYRDMFSELDEKIAELENAIELDSRYITQNILSEDADKIAIVMSKENKLHNLEKALNKQIMLRDELQAEAAAYQGLYARAAEQVNSYLRLIELKGAFEVIEGTQLTTAEKSKVQKFLQSVDTMISERKHTIDAFLNTDKRSTYRMQLKLDLKLN